MVLAAMAMSAAAQSENKVMVGQKERRDSVALREVTEKAGLDEKRDLAVQQEKTDSTTQAGKRTTMKEVTVKAARTVQQADGMWLFPTRKQLESSPNGYSLLAKLSLPHIRVDEAMSSITALSSIGGVQVRINDVAASKEDLMALDMEGVQRVEFIDNPSLRYGEGIAYVINIKVKKPVGGYVLGADLTSTLTTVSGNENVFGKVNHGRSEWAFSYGLNYNRFRGEEYDELATYHLETVPGGFPAGSPSSPSSPSNTVTLHRQLLSKQDRSLSHNAQLTYSLSDSNFVFQARLAGNQTLRPSESTSTMALDDVPYNSNSASRGYSPSLDLYFHQDFRRHQSLTANVVGTLIQSTGEIERDGAEAYAYDTDGRTRSLWSEALYENRLRPFTISAGTQFGLRRSHNLYNGDVEATNTMHTSDINLFAQLQGRWRRLGYMGGLGVSQRYYRQEGRRQHFWLFRPKFTLSYSITDHLRARYAFEISQHVSQIALVSDVSIRLNQMETLVGNPDIHPNRVTSHDLHLTYSRPGFTSDLQGYYRLNSHCNMERYIRVNDHFYQTQTNADNACNFFYIQSYNQWDIIPEHLSLSAYGGIYRFFNYGEDYTHTYTSYNGGYSLQAYLGRWTLGAYADHGWNFMEGEHRGHQGATWYLTASYRTKFGLHISLFAQNPFCRNPRTNKTELLSRYIQKTIVQHHRDYGNMITLRLSYRLDHGRRYRDIQRTMNHTDRETGILSK